MAKRVKRKMRKPIEKPAASRPVMGRVQEPPVERLELPDLSERAQDPRFWPEDKPLPTEYVKLPRQPMPCRRCRRVLMDNRGQAVVCIGSGHHQVFFRCKVCDYRWGLPVREVEPR